MSHRLRNLSSYSADGECEEEDENADIQWGGHGKRISHSQMSQYSGPDSINLPGIPTKIIRDQALMAARKSRASSHISHATDASEQFAETEVIGIISINGEGTILFSNSKAQEIFGEPTLTNQSLHDYVPNTYFGTDRFQDLHRVLIKSFFSKQFAGGRMLDPGTILRAKLRSGKLVPLNVGLEAKLNPDGTPRIVVGYITEASQIIDQSKVEKMLSRATLVILQQFISQTILSIVGIWELMYVPPLRYPNDIDDDTVLVNICKDYTFNKLTLDGEQGDQDYKMMLYVLSSAMTILISVLPLFVNHMKDHSEASEAAEKKRWSVTKKFRDFANWINDAQEYLSTFKTYRAFDIVSLTTVVSIVNLFLLYELKSLPSEYEMSSVDECEHHAQDEINLSVAMCALGIIPFLYLMAKLTYKWMIHGCRMPKFGQSQVMPSSQDKEGSHFGARSSRNRSKQFSKESLTFKKFESRMSASSLNSARSDDSDTIGIRKQLSVIQSMDNGVYNGVHSVDTDTANSGTF